MIRATRSTVPPPRRRARAAADGLVQDFGVDEVEQRPDPGLARGDDLAAQRVKPPAQVAQHVLGQVSSLVADFPERFRPASVHAAATASMNTRQ
jgi:hypothetical protein